MIIKRLRLVQLRVFEQTELEFGPGMNLLVGVNGVGKTTVLDVLRICLSKILPKATVSRSRPLPFTDDDIRTDSPFLTVQFAFEFAGVNYDFLTHKQRQANVPLTASNIREQTLATPDKETCTPDLSKLGRTAKDSATQPLGLFFSTRRSLVSDARGSDTKAAGGQAGAFADALASRELRLTDLASWLHAQETLAGESSRAKDHIAALRRAAAVFLPECRNLQAQISPKPRLIVDKNGVSLDVRQLSDGERGSLALVLDLARRLSQANPGLADPVTQGQAVVLIDELDLHLHPQWQRTIVERLTNTFPRCQFIATTHSPQIVGEVAPEKIRLLGAELVETPAQSFGMDTNWVLRVLMGTGEQNLGIQRRLDAIFKLIAQQKLDEAEGNVRQLRQEIGNSEALQRAASTIERIRILGQ